MALHTLSDVEDRFPVGVTVSVYRRPAPGAWSGSGTPPGAVVTTAVVQADGSVTFAGLTETVSYTAFAAGSCVTFRVDESPAAVVSDLLPDVASGSPRDLLRLNAAGTAFELVTPAPVTLSTLTGLGAAAAADLTAHVADASDAHHASAIGFVPTGTIAATDVQAAVAEVASEAGP